VTDSQDHDLFSVVVVGSNIGATSEFNHPLSELRWHLFYRAADLRVLAKCFYAPPDRLDGAPGCVPAFGSEEIVEAGNV
jgi:hypothetical protein